MTSPAPERLSILGRIALAVAFLGLVALVGALSQMQIDRTPTVAAGRANLGALWPFWIASAIGWLGLTGLWLGLRRRAGGFSWISGGIVLVVALLARVVVIGAHDPQLSDDIYRYVFDGRNAAHDVNPYMVKPADRVGLSNELYLEQPLAVVLADGTALVGGERWPGERELLVLVNNPDVHTIYLPVSQWVFHGVGIVLGERWNEPGEGARVLRLVLVVFELAMITLLLVALRARGRSAWWVALYAWHPLAVTEIAGSGHQDALGLCLLVLAMTLWQLNQDRVMRWSTVLALAVLVKPVALPVAPLLLRGHSWRRWIGSALVGATVCAVVAAPLWLPHDRQPLDNLAGTAERFSLKWAHFGSVYEPVLTQIENRTPEWTNDEQEVLARRICIGLVGAVFVLAFFAVRDAWAAARMIFLAMVLLSPTAQPWYVLWALVLVPVAPGPAVWLASLTISWGYAQLGDVVGWTISPKVMIAAYAPIYIAVVADLVHRVRRRDAGHRDPETEARDRLRNLGSPLRPEPKERP